MTLVLAIASVDGLVLASDSQTTYSTSGQPVKGETQKIFCPWTNAAWGASGHVGLIQRAQECLATKIKPNAFQRADPRQVRDLFGKAISDGLRHLFMDRFINIPNQQSPTSTFLLVGYASNDPFIIEVGSNFADTSHIDEGYAAIGSGDIFSYFALASLTHFDVRNRSLDEAKLLAYRVMDDAIGIAGFGLGPPIQMIEIKQPNPGNLAETCARELTHDELRILADKVTEWKMVECETLTNIVGIRTTNSDAGVSTLSEATK